LAEKATKITQVDDTYNNAYMVIGSNCFSPKSDMSVDENAAENMQGKN